MEKNEQRPSKMLSRAFWAGFGAHLCITGAIQDWMGKEEFLRRANSDWMNTHWLMWVVLGGVCLAVYGWQLALVRR